MYSGILSRMWNSSNKNGKQDDEQPLVEMKSADQVNSLLFDFHSNLVEM